MCSPLQTQYQVVSTTVVAGMCVCMPSCSAIMHMGHETLETFTHTHIHTHFHTYTHIHAHIHSHTHSHTHSHMLSSDQYKFLVLGEAEREVTDFLTSEHSLQEYREKIEHFRAVGREIAGLDDVVLFQMFHLECHDIKRGLGIMAQNMVSQLVGQLAEKHIQENKRCV